MAQAEERKTYWKDQIKSMLGPCMITFAIPLTVPGLTITFVAYSDDSKFPPYSAMHITGLLLLVLAVFLIVLGCVLRYVWKPFIIPDLEKHLTPTPSMLSHSSHSRRSRMDRIFRRDRLSKRSHESLNSGTDPFTKIQNERKMVVPKTEDVSRSHVTHEIESESNTSIQETDEGQTCKPELDTPLHMATPRAGQLPPISPRPLCSNIEQSGSLTENQGQPPTLDDIQVWRKKKRKRRKKREEREDSKMDAGVINKASDCEDNRVNTEDNDFPCIAEKTKDEPDVSGGSIRSSNHSLLNEEVNEHQEKKRKKRKKKRSALASLKMDSTEKSPEKHKKEHAAKSSTSKAEMLSQTQPLRMTSDNGIHKSDESDGSIGSVDSVLAQYTSRSDHGHEKI